MAGISVSVMDQQIITLYQEDNKNELKKQLERVSTKDICALIECKVTKGTNDLGILIRAVISGLSNEQRFAVYKCCINLLRDVELNAKTANAIIDALCTGIDDLPPNNLVELATEYVESIKNAQTTSWYLELLPKIMSSMDVSDLLSHDGHQMSGTDFRNHIINNICSNKWDGQIVLSLVIMFKDIPLKDDQFGFVLTKAVRMMKEVQLQELPPLIYQMLILSNKGHKKHILEGIIKHFVEQDMLHKTQQSESDVDKLEEASLSTDQLYVVEGTVILHIKFALQQDQELGKQLIKYLKSEQENPKGVALAPFSLALVLSCIKIHRFEEQIVEFLKAAILKRFKDIDRQNRSWWISDMIDVLTDMTPCFMDTIKNSVHGWDYVVQGLVIIGFVLMDVFGPKSCFGKFVTNTPTGTLTPSQRACKLGSDILLETFKTHELVQQEILEQILNRIVTKASAPVSHYLDLLSKAVRCAPQVLLDSLSKVQEAFDYLSYLPPNTAEALLKAVQPLLKISMALKDSLILVLRKALFSRQMDARCMAVKGFLMILKNFKVLGALPFSQCSQTTDNSQHVKVDVYVKYDPSHNEGFCLEILGYLRRCLTQQPAVRITLYNGLLDVISHNSKMAPAILYVLHHQLQKYYEADKDVIPPCKLEPCIVIQAENVYVQEPLAHLLHCAIHCCLKARRMVDDEDDEDNDQILQRLQEMIESVTDRMLKSDLDSFQLDKSADFSLGTSVGTRNNICALLLAGIYEVLMEYTFISGGQLDETRCETVLKLYKKNQQLLEIIKEKSTAGGTGGGKRKQTGKAAASGSVHNKQNSLVSLLFLDRVIDALYNDDDNDNQGDLSHLHRSHDFQLYILTVTLHKLTPAGSSESEPNLSRAKIQKHCTSIVRVLLKSYLESFGNAGENQQDKFIQLNVLRLEVVAKIINAMCDVYEDNIVEFFSVVAEACGLDVQIDASVQHLAYSIIKKLQSMVLSVIVSEDDQHSQKEAFHLMMMINTLTKHIPPAEEAFAKIVNWLSRICTEQDIDDVPLTKVLISQLFKLSAQRANCVNLLRDVAVNIHSQLGDIDQEVEIDQSTTISIVNQCTAAPTILLLLLNQIDVELDDTEWVLTMLKGLLASTETDRQGDDSVACTQREKQEKSLCTRLGYLVNTFHELSQSALPAGICVLSLIKVLCHLYNVLAALVKYYLYLYQMKHGYITTRFEKLVKLSATNLTPYVYAMITYLQAVQSEALKMANEKNKKDKKKQESVMQAGKNQVLKESKSIPNLIFAIEQYEKYLIQLSKKSKIHLMDHFKMSTSRDFRINQTCLQQALEENNSVAEDDTVDQSREEMESTADQPQDENTEPPVKRSKVAEEKTAAKPKTKLTKAKK